MGRWLLWMQLMTMLNLPLLLTVGWALFPAVSARAVTNIYRADRSDQLHLLSVVPRVAGPYPAEVSRQAGDSSSGELSVGWCRQAAAVHK